MRQAASTRTGSTGNLSAGRSLSLFQATPKFPPPTILPLVAPADRGPAPAAARAGDHLEIHRLLRNVFYGPTQSEFNAQLEAPGYQPAQRLVMSCGREIAAHVRMAPAVVQFGAATLPVCTLMDLATAPLNRKRGLASALVADAETRAREAGDVLGCVRTTAAEFFLRRGWAVCGRHSFSTIDPCRLLTAIAERDAVAAKEGSTLLRPKTPRVWRVRPFLRYDLPAVMRLEAAARAGRFGAFERDQPRWEWLLERKAFDTLYVVADGRTPNDVIGYLVGCESRIGELIVDPAADGAGERLLAMFCRDAIERGVSAVRYDGPPDDPRHAFIVAAGGKRFHEPVCGGEVYCVKALDPQRLLELTAPMWRGRGELTIECQDGKTKAANHLDGGSGRVTLAPQTGGCRVQLTAAQLAPLVLGGLSERAFELAAKNRRAAETATAFFPSRPWYTPSWEQWTAR